MTESSTSGGARSFPQLSATDIMRHSHVRTAVLPGDELWIADVVGDDADPIVSLCFKNIEFYGRGASIRQMVQGFVDLFDDLDQRPELADRLLPRIKRNDASGRREGPHPLIRQIA